MKYHPTFQGIADRLRVLLLEWLPNGNHYVALQGFRRSGTSGNVKVSDCPVSAVVSALPVGG
jgi:hypothetical protein